MADAGTTHEPSFNQAMPGSEPMTEAAASPMTEADPSSPDIAVQATVVTPTTWDAAGSGSMPAHDGAAVERQAPPSTSANATNAPVAIKVDAGEEARLLALLAKQKKVAATTNIVVVASRNPPATTDLAGWQKIIEDADWEGLAEESVIEAYDHFRAVVAQSGGKRTRPDEFECALALRRRLEHKVLTFVWKYIPYDHGARGSEYKSARKTAVKHLHGLMDDRTWKRGEDLRHHFQTTARFVCKAALEHQFGRKGNKWSDPQRRKSLDVDPSPADALDDPWAVDDSESAGSKHAGAFFDRMGLRRTHDLQYALTRAIAELPSVDHALIVLLSYIGHPNSEIAPVFGLSEPTIAARLHHLAASPHLQPFRK